MYYVELKQSAVKDLKKIEKKFRNKILSSIENLAINPYKGNIKKLIFTQTLFRLRVGNFRIIFQIVDREQRLIIHYIRHRKDAYKHL